MDTIIRSTDNTNVKRAAKLQQKKFRDESGLYRAEGERLIRDIAAWDSTLIAELFISESYYVLHNRRDFNIETHILSDIVFEKLSETENSQGIIAVVRKNVSKPLAAERCLFLDRVRDPGNLGTIIRTAAAFGFTDIICRDCADVYGAKTVRSAMSGVAVCNYPSMTITDIRTAGYTVICADLAGTSLHAYKAGKQKLCLVIGNEANGISDEILCAADVRLRIPMENMESLNAAVSAGIMMYALNK